MSCVREENQWKGKVWYAYGTSITNIYSEGKYPTYLEKMSEMKLVCKGISGGGIGNLGGYSKGQVYDAICNVTDGKTEADIITLETGANDTGPGVKIGSIYDTGRNTLCGCLNDCLRYLQTNTNAQIAVWTSPASIMIPNEKAHQYYEWAETVERVCHLNRVHFLFSDNNMGFAKLNSQYAKNYIVDQIHHTDLGGYVMAQNIWYQLRNIPCFPQEMPEM